MKKGELKTKKGVILPRKATLIGGWCEVYRKDRSRPVYREVELSAYNTHKNWWQKAPGQMIEKSGNRGGRPRCVLGERGRSIYCG